MLFLQPFAIAVAIAMSTAPAIQAMPREITSENPVQVDLSAIGQAEESLQAESPNLTTVTEKEMAAFAMPYIARKKALEDLLANPGDLSADQLARARAVLPRLQKRTREVFADLQTVGFRERKVDLVASTSGEHSEDLVLTSPTLMHPIFAKQMMTMLQSTNIPTVLGLSRIIFASEKSIHWIFEVQKKPSIQP